MLATLVFRLVSFWLPMPVGAVAGIVFRRRYPRRNRFPGADTAEHPSDDDTLEAEMDRFDATRRIP